jgi:hypothetical protein
MKHLIDIYKVNQEHDDGSIGHQVIMAVVKDNYLAICENEIERLGKKLYTFETKDWGDGIASEEPVEDKSISNKEAVGYNKAIQEQLNYWNEQRALIVKEK